MIVSIEESIEVARKLREEKRKIVLAGGCFDILHIGHITFLQKAKEAGDSLFVLLESDERIRTVKGVDRPINSQQDRAALLAALRMVDYVITLPGIMTNTGYDKLVFSLKPAIIATTKSDSARPHKERQAAALHIPVLDVVGRIQNQSTSKVAALLEKEL